ncbi:MAG TPA: endonuclease/exonuclease/phosphatase family protein [Gaiellaceae bacterium]
MLVRSWNLYHGNPSPPGGTNYLERMVRLASEDQPEVLCLQEVPVWALSHLTEWSGMTVLGDVAKRPTLGPLPSTAEVGRRLTALNPGLLRSAFSGQANALLTTLEVLGRWRCVLNPRGVRRRADVDVLARLAWVKERRICQAARLRLPDGKTAIVANLHASHVDPRVTLTEVERAAAFATGLAAPDEPVVLAGDFNTAPDLGAYGFDEAGWGIDHVLVRGLPAGEQRAWPEERRRLDGVLLSDHAPVEREVG